MTYTIIVTVSAASSECLTHCLATVRTTQNNYNTKYTPVHCSQLLFSKVVEKITLLLLPLLAKQAVAHILMRETYTRKSCVVYP